ncbi:TonB-dependent receptor domain-containing protein [Frigidibacter sp. MR17.24]|uniref:TonB-dependent receptor domain-containing protein n=1 Tax=Frigidibacter sp. MR17.24 TaxID=3127345 RepID=UPI003012FA2A
MQTTFPRRGTPARALYTLFGSTALVPVLVCTAAAQDSTGTLTLDQIVVTAGGFEQNVADAPASVTVITGEELARASVTSLSDALAEAQGVVTTGVPNEEDISIRGLPGQYTLILVDGKRQGTRESRPNGSSGYEQSFVPPVAAIDRIEIVRGPMSSLYGSDAIGGVVNIITKPVSPEWTGSTTIETTQPEHSRDGASTQGSFYLSGPIVSDKLGLQLWGRRLDKAESGIIDGPQGRDDRDLTARLTWTPAEGQEFGFELGRSEIERDASVGNTVEAGGDDDRQDNDRTHYALTHKGDWGWATSDFALTREEGRRTTYSVDDDGDLVRDDRRPEITNTVADFKLTTPFTAAGTHTVVSGLQFQRNELDDQNPGLATEGSWSRDQWAVYAEDEWRLHPDFALTLGARYTEDEDFGGHVSPRIYAVWNATPDLTVKGGVSTGYRTPDLRSIAEGYYYTTQQGRGVIVANPDLKPEESTSYELGVLWQGRIADRGVELGATAFRTDFTDKIESFNTGERVTIENGNTYNRWAWDNVSDAMLQGIELTARFDLTPDLSMRASYTYTESEMQSGDYEGLPLMRTPKNAASLRLDWATPVAGLDAWGAVTYHGEEINAGARIGSNGTPYRTNDAGSVIAYKYDGYTTVDLGASYAINDHATVNGALYNVFDEGVGLEASNAVIEGRRLWLGLTTSF